MTTEGSDEQLAELADTAQVGTPVRRHRFAAVLEEWRVRAQPTAPGDPGADHPDLDEAPPGEEPHPEFDPVPPPVNWTAITP
jgi:hypothetical protein